MIYLSGMASIIPLVVSLVLILAPQSAGKPGPWKSLFDGKSLDAWRIYKSDAAPKLCAPPATTACWDIKDGALWKDGNANDMITKEQFGDFELELQWKIGKAGNSGIFYRGTEEHDRIYWSAPEYQLLDNIKASDNKRPDHLAGAAYELSMPPADAVKKVGEWNLTRIIAKGHHIEHWLNGVKTAEFEVGSPEWDAKVGASKFKVYPNYGRAKKGHLALQGDHTGELAFRNIRIRDLQ